jgi:L-fuconate dehydratase
MARCVSLEPIDVRFPTWRHLNGFDAMNPEPDYSAAYLAVRADADDGLEGNAFTFTTGRGPVWRN